MSTVDYKPETGYIWKLLGKLARAGGSDTLVLFLARCLYHLKVEGIENLPASGTCLIAANHQAMVTDALVYLTVRQRRPDLHFFGWQSYQGQSPLLAFMQRYGESQADARFLRAYKARGISAVELLRARQLILDGNALLIAVEGELTWDGHLQYPLSPGAAWLGLRTAATIVPLVAVGGYDIQPRWDMNHIRLSGRVHIQLGQPFTLRPSSRDMVRQVDVESASQRIYNALAGLLGH
jgi:1-acyl-sn-glycerol-3-phosphate acyltransferase